MIYQMIGSYQRIRGFHVTQVSLIITQLKNKIAYNPGGGTLGISGWGCAAGTLEPSAYTRASSAKFCSNQPYRRLAVFQKLIFDSF